MLLAFYQGKSQRPHAKQQEDLSWQEEHEQTFRKLESVHFNRWHQVVAL